MADSSVAVTAGSGTAIDTRTEATNGNHRQVVVIGDPSTNAGVAPVDATNGLAVDVKAIVPGTSASALGKAEDAVHASADVGVMALAVQTATPINRAGTDGDYEPLQISAGRLWTSATVDAALPAGTNAIGKLAANSGVDIGDVDVTSVIPGTGATNLGKAEDAGHTSGDVGVMALSVRQDTAAALGGTDADYQPLITDASGRLHVNVGNTVTVGSHAVTNAGTFAVQVDGSALTALQLIDDPVATLGTTTYSEATTKGMIAAALRRDADTSAVNTDNELAPLIVDANGYLKVEIFDGGGSHTVDNAGTFAVQVDGNALTALQLIDDIVYTDDTSTHATGTSKGALLMAAATPTDASVNANDIGAVGMTTDRKLHVAVMDALPAGTAAIGKLAANSGVDIGDVDVTSIATGTNAIGRVGHDTTGLGHGVTTVTTAGTDVALAGSTACKWVQIQAQTDNTNKIAVGASGVDATVATGNGIILDPGDVVTIPIDNLADVFIDSLVNGEGVRYMYGT